MKRISVVSVVPVGLLAFLSVGLASPVSGAPAVEMPDITGMNLQDAAEAFDEAAAGMDLELAMDDLHSPTKPISLSNWTVCWQGPSAGEPLAEAPWAAVAVTRSGTECW